MKRFVLDASVALRWFLDRTVPGYAIQVRQMMLSGARAFVPALWHLEMVNGLIIAERRGILASADVDRGLTDIDKLLAASFETDSELVPARAASALARAFRLSAYDAVYLDLARREGLPLATLDEKLKAAAPQAGVKLVR
ncbi:MAG: type II toxin-antitoxin system VapC family toxin [Terriglobia bacterium]